MEQHHLAVGNGQESAAIFGFLGCENPSRPGAKEASQTSGIPGENVLVRGYNQVVAAREGEGSRFDWGWPAVLCCMFWRHLGLLVKQAASYRMLLRIYAARSCVGSLNLSGENILPKAEAD